MDRRHFCVAVILTFAVTASAQETFIRSQTLSYMGDNGGPIDFGRQIVVDEPWLAILSKQSTYGGVFNIPFPGKLATVFIYGLIGGEWQPVTAVYDEITEDVHAGVIDLSGSRIVHGISVLNTAVGVDAGRVWTYVADPIWRKETEILSPNPQPSANFGLAVALEGNTLVVVAAGAPHAGLASVAYVYSFGGGSWNHVQTLTLPSPSTYMYSVAMDQDRLVFGTFENDGALFIYERTGAGFEFKQMLVPPAGRKWSGYAEIAGDMLVALSTFDEPVSVAYVHRLIGGTWSLSEQLDFSDRSEPTWRLTVSMTRSKLLLAASAATVNGQPRAGLARLYRRSGDRWVRAADFTDATPGQNEGFANGAAAGKSHVLMNKLSSESNFTWSEVDVYLGPADPSLRRRPVRPR